MVLFKNGIKRTSNSFIRKRKIFYIGTLVVLFASILVSGYFIVNRFNGNLNSNDTLFNIKYDNLKLNSHIKASYIIGRRGMGIKEKVPKQYKDLIPDNTNNFKQWSIVYKNK